MKLILIGDIHATVDSLEECQRLIDFIDKTASNERVENICFLGDLYHNHGVVHLPVQAFWERAFSKISKKRNVYVIVGNHDRALISEKDENALMLHNGIKVINEPFIKDGILFMPYFSDIDEFVNKCNEFSDNKVLICHQSFNCSKLDNGYYDKEGIDIDLIPQHKVIAGHIHTASESNKLWHPGSPRWRTMSDANQDRYIWVVEIEDNKIAKRGAYPTDISCKPIFVLQDTENDPIPVRKIEGDCTVEIIGSQEFIDKRKNAFFELGYKVRALPTNNKILKVKESDGIAIAFTKFLKEYKTRYIDNELLLKMAMERVSWLQPQ